ncbi:MAG: hypothetical protein K2J39_09815, partial [Ruminococcus sp.]|nr:hypothetical protein [Ruminococcus sp.]
YFIGISYEEFEYDLKMSELGFPDSEENEPEFSEEMFIDVPLYPCEHVHITEVHSEDDYIDLL